ncbi:hypothetical protein Efla_001756 [Eimeria flavescens]
MKAYGAVFAATCSIVSSGAIDILEGPEFIDVLLPEVAHVFGMTSAHHTTLEEMNLRAEDVYVLPRAPKVEDCLSALEGMPMTRQAKPFADSVSMLDIKPYQNAQLRIAEARAAELAASVAPVSPAAVELGGWHLSYSGVQLVSLAPKSKSYRTAAFFSIEIAPGLYQSPWYAVVQAIIYSILVRTSKDLLDFRRATGHFKKILMGITFFIYHSLAIVLLHNVLGIRALLALPMAIAFGLVALSLALRSVDSVEHLRRMTDCCPFLQGMERVNHIGNSVPFHTRHLDVQEPLGYCASVKMYCILIANLSYHAISTFLPYRYGLAGFVTGNVMFAGLLYAAYLAAVSLMVLKKIKEDADSRKVQARVISMDCAYIVASGVSFYGNLIAVYGGIGDFVALEPAVFFTASRTLELNIGTIIMVIALLAMFGVGYHEQNQMDSSGKNVSSISSVAVATHEEARRALEEALTESSTKSLSQLVETFKSN